MIKWYQQGKSLIRKNKANQHNHWGFLSWSFQSMKESNWGTLLQSFVNYSTRRSEEAIVLQLWQALQWHCWLGMHAHHCILIKQELAISLCQHCKVTAVGERKKNVKIYNQMAVTTLLWYVDRGCWIAWHCCHGVSMSNSCV